MRKIEKILQQARADYVRVYQYDFSQARKLKLMVLGTRCLNLRKRIDRIEKIKKEIRSVA